MKFGFIIYGFGLVLLMFTDMIISRAFSAEDISDWARFRSLVGIAAVIPLVGLDQVLVRSPAASAQVLRLVLVQVPVLGICVGFALAWTGLIADWWLGAGLAIGSASSLVVFQYFRSHHYQLLSQVAQQGWKIAAFGAVGLMLLTGWRGDLLTLGVALLGGVTVAMMAMICVLPPSRMCPQQPESVRAHYAIGSRFMVTALMLALSVYAEQLIVIRLGTEFEAELYFTSAVYFLFFPTFFNGYLAFLMGPWVRDRHDRFVATIRRRWLVILVGTAGYSVLLNLIGAGLWLAISPSVGQIDSGLQVLFLVMAFVRSLYLLPSGYLGIFGMPREHSRLIVFQIIAVLPVVGLFFVLRAFGFELVHAVAAASVLNWSLRTIVGYTMIAIVTERRKQDAYDG